MPAWLIVFLSVTGGAVVVGAGIGLAFGLALLKLMDSTED